MDWIARGGIIMAPIFVFSVVALGIFLERLIVLRRSQVMPADNLREIEALLRAKRIKDTRTYCQANPSPIGRILFAGLQHYGGARYLIKENMEERGKAEALELKKHLGLLQTIASVCPLLGLLGTVSGMIKVFSTISMEGVGNPGSLATGISEALITTAAWLSVAIPAYMGQRYLVSRAERLIHMLEEFATYLINLIPAQMPAAGEDGG